MKRALPWATAVLAAALLVTGALVLALSESPRPAALGWSASAPLAAETPVPYASSLTLTFDERSVVWGAGQLLGAGLAVAGLLLLAGLAGWALGRRGHGRAA